MQIDPESFDLAELSERAEVSARTVRYYIQQGLLPSPEARGPGAHYGQEHLDRLRLIKRLQHEHLPLAEIRRRLESVDPAEIARLANRPAEPSRSSARDYIRGVLSEGAPMLRARRSAPDAPDAQAAAPPPAASMPPDAVAKLKGQMKGPGPVSRSQWDRFVLAPDVELHVRRPLSREQNRQVERLMEAARDIFEEDAP